MLISFYLTRNDLKAFLKCFRAHNKTWAINSIIVITGGIIFISTGIYFLCLNVDKPVWPMAGIILGATLLILPHLRERQILKQELPSVDLSLSEDGLEIKNKNKDIYEGHKWSNFEGWSETSMHFFLFISANRGIIIPKESAKPSDLVTPAIEFIKSKTHPFQSRSKQVIFSPWFKNVPIFIWIFTFLAIFLVLRMGTLSKGENFDIRPYYFAHEDSLYSDQNYVVKIAMDKDEVSAGEPINIHYRLVSRYPTDDKVDVRFLTNPHIQGMDSKVIDNEGLIKSINEVHEGKVWERDLFIVRLTGKESGTYFFKSGKFKVVLNEKSKHENSLSVDEQELPIDVNE